MEKRLRSPVMACETVDGNGTCHDADKGGVAVGPGVDVPEEEGVGEWP